MFKSMRDPHNIVRTFYSRRLIYFQVFDLEYFDGSILLFEL